MGDAEVSHFSKAKGPAPEAEEIIVDCFAGGGGASLGIEMALGRSPDIAVNHDPEALAMHRANHPRTVHYIEDIRDVDPIAVCDGRPVGLAWFSPDCKHHSNAKGGPPIRSKEIRALAWTVVDWARLVRPRVIILENVREFEKWGPLNKHGRIIKSRVGEEFEFWWKRMEHLGYRGEMRLLKACDYGTPTSRERLYIIWRCDGEPIAWPEPTHGPGRALPYLTAAGCIDWTIPCPSIFMTKRQAKAFTKRTGIKVKRPLAKKTMARIARGLRKYLFEAFKPFVVPKPFMVPLTHAGYRPDGAPRNDERVYDATQPMPTITGANRGEIGVVAPLISNVKTYGGGGNDAVSAERPLRTVVASSKRGEIAVVQPHLSVYYGDRREDEGPRASGLDEPVPTVTAGGNRFAVVAPVAVRTDMHKSTTGLDEPLPTVSAHGNHHGAVQAFLGKYYGKSTEEPIDQPLHTITTKDRFSLVVIEGQIYRVEDVGMRMLKWRELGRAQGFPDSYQFAVPYKGRPLSDTAIVRMIGNSVCPQVACAIVAANYQVRRVAIA